MPSKQSFVATQQRKPVDKNHYPVKPVTDTLTNGFFTVDNTWTVKNTGTRQQKKF